MALHSLCISSCLTEENVNIHRRFELFFCLTLNKLLINLSGGCLKTIKGIDTKITAMNQVSALGQTLC